jgi:hypothetical protein
MPGSIFGMDIDDLLKLATPKYVYIKDWKLGAIKYSLMIVILFYVLVYDLLYMCSHLKPHVAQGYGSIGLKHPTSKEGKLNFANLVDCKYCREHELVGKKVKRLLSDKSDKPDDKPDEDSGEPQVGDWVTRIAPCRYLDSDRLTLTDQPNEVFIPMRYVSYEQEIDEGCYDPVITQAHGFHTRKVEASSFDCQKAWKTKKNEEFYVADIGDFKLDIQHSFLAPTIGLQGVSSKYRGFFAACPNNHPKDVKKECKRMVVPNTEGTYAPEDAVGLVNQTEMNINSLTGSETGSDTISVLDLLKLTPVAQDFKWREDVADRKLPDHFGHPKESIREAGGMLMLSVSYDNTGPGRPGFPFMEGWGMDDVPLLGAIKEITYTYRPYFVPSNDNKKVEVKFDSDASKTRTVNVWYGITVKLSFEGKLVKFSAAAVFTALATALVLLTSATTIVTYGVLYLGPTKYGLLMYQTSEDFTNWKEMRSNKSATGAFGKTVDYVTGQTLIEAMDKDEVLSKDQLLNILMAYEVRLNKLDGQDPHLAFETELAEDSASKHQNQDAMKVRKRVKDFEKSFYAKHKRGGAE